MEAETSPHAFKSPSGGDALYRQLFRVVAQGCILAELIRDADGRAIDYRLLEANPAAERLLGFAMAEILGRRVSELYPSLEPYGLDVAERVTRTGVPEQVEYALMSVGRWRQATMYPAGGDLFFSLYDDITERRRADARVRDREADLARTQRIARMGGIDIDVAGGLVSWRSPEYLRLHGLPPDTGRESHADWLARVHPEDRERAERAFFDALNGASASYGSEYRIVRPLDGEVRWIQARMDIERDAAGKPLRLVGAHLDVTDQKRSEIALRESEERLGLAIEIGELASWDWDLRSGRVTWNDRHFLMQGYDIGQLTPSYDAWVARIHPDDCDGTVAALERARDGRFTYAHEFRTLTPDGSVRWCSARGRFFYDAQGVAQRMIGVMEDVTDRKEADIVLRKSMEHQRILLHELQHRVRNTLAVVRSIASRTGEASDTVEDFAFHLEGRLNALARTQMVLTRAPGEGVDLEMLIREELLAQVAQEEQVEVEGPQVRLSDKAAEVLGLAVHELATNAVKYGALADGRGDVDVRWDTTQEYGRPWVRLIWREKGVRLLGGAPRRRGFGAELIETRVPYELRGRGALTFAPGGVTCVLEFPLLPGDSILQTRAPSSGTGG